MNTESTLERLGRVIRSSLRQPNAVVSATTTADDIGGWDSISHAVLLMDIERTFAIRFIPAEVIEVEHVGDLVAIIDRMLKGRSHT